MLYQGQFRTVHDNDLITVDLVTNNLTTTTIPIKLAKNSPVTIDQTSNDGLFSAIKSRSCTITLITDSIYEELYTGEAQGVSVTVTNTTKGEIIFEGYLTPCAYSQDFISPGDELQLEAVDRISTLEQINYYCIDGDNESPKIKTIHSILYHIFSQAGYTGNIYYQYYSFGNSMLDYNLAEANFFDDDDEKTPWTMYEVLEQICLFFGWSTVPYGKDVYIVDYQAIQKYGNGPGADSVRYYKVNSTGEEVITGPNKIVTISKDSYTGKDQTISYDDVYNKISISASIYEVDEISNDIFDSDEGNLENNFWRTLGQVRHKLINKKKKWFSTKYTLKQDWDIAYTTFSFGNKSNWKQRFFMPDTLTETPNYSFNGTHDDWDSMEKKFADTICALPEKVWLFNNMEGSSSSISPKNIIAFNVLTFDDYFQIKNLKNTSTNPWHDLFNKMSSITNCPVLTLTYPEEIQYYPFNGNSFICFKGDLWYQCHNTSKVWILDDEDGYWKFHFPTDGIAEATNEYAYVERYPSDEDYNKGWKEIRAKLKIGDKYWNGSVWTTEESTFNISYHKADIGLSSTENEKLVFEGWNKPVYNTILNSDDIYTADPTKLIGEDYFAIPINTPLYGKLEFTLYPPVQPYDSTYIDDPTKFCPVIYMKDFELTYKYVPSGYNWVVIDQYDDGDDIIYSNVINDKYCTEFDDLELKINTYADKKPISRSYIMGYDKSYITDFEKNGSLQRQEYNLINMYHQHYSTPKKIYECTIHDYLHPGDLVTTTATSGNFMVDEQSYDVKLNHNSIKLIEY